MIEKRQHPRFDPEFFLQVFDLKTNLPVGKVINISKTGMLLLCEKSLKEEDKYAFWVEIPYGYTTTQHVAFKAQCVWLKKITHEKEINCGFVFINPSKKFAIFINELINHISFKYKQKTPEILSK